MWRRIGERKVARVSTLATSCGEPCVPLRVAVGNRS
jgi:hypothetical protein